MKTTDKNEKSRNVLPFAVVQKATEGDIVVDCQVKLTHFYV